MCDLLNKSLFAGKFPENRKIARIAPIFKSGAKDDRSNYRPITVLLFISRLFEKLIFNQFYEYLDANKSLYEHQSGFRLLLSVATALLASTNDWYLNIGTGKYTGLIFIDLKKAFDTVHYLRTRYGWTSCHLYTGRGKRFKEGWYLLLAI